MAMIIFNQRYKGRLARVVTAAKALEIQEALDHPQDNLSDEQSDFLMAIKRIYHNKGSNLPKTAHTASTRLIADENSKLTNPGIQQGMYSAIPNGDR